MTMHMTITSAYCVIEAAGYSSFLIRINNRHNSTCLVQIMQNFIHVSSRRCLQHTRNVLRTAHECLLIEDVDEINGDTTRL